MKGRRSAINHFFDALKIQVTVLSIAIWMLAATAAGGVTYLLWRKGKIRASSALLFPILVFYLSFVIAITLVERVPAEKALYKLELFWSYKAIMSGSTELIGEVFWNVVLFVPVGLLVAALSHRRRWLSIMACFILSAGIEITQFFTRRGLFEWDDIIHNSLGALIGFLLFFLLMKRRRRDPQTEQHSA